LLRSIEQVERTWLKLTSRDLDSNLWISADLGCCCNHNPTEVGHPVSCCYSH
jgi:hypothetical protein